MSQLVEDMDQIKEQNETLRSALRQTVEETEGLKVRLQVRGWNRCHGVSVDATLVSPAGGDDEADGETATRRGGGEKTKLGVRRRVQTKRGEIYKKKCFNNHKRCRQNPVPILRCSTLQARAQEKLDRAEMKINLLQEEREELRGRVHAHSAEVAT